MEKQKLGTALAFALVPSVALHGHLEGDAVTLEPVSRCAEQKELDVKKGPAPEVESHRAFYVAVDILDEAHSDLGALLCAPHIMGGTV